jgi:hypothetical protein
VVSEKHGTSAGSVLNHPTMPTHPGLDQSMVHSSMITQLQK